MMTHSDPASVPILRSFFKTAGGQYGEGDVFVGIRMPDLREVCRACGDVGLKTIGALLRSRVHEERLLALLLLVAAYNRGGARERREIYDFYLSHTASINNWDLVDASASPIVGAWLSDRNRSALVRLARSASLWERRIAIVATHYFIRHGDVADTFRIADILLDDPHDLIHKAVGWMLREAGIRDGAAERRFLKTRHRRMPRTMLRYAIEKFPEAERRGYLRDPAVRKASPRTAAVKAPGGRSASRSLNR